MQLKEPIFPFNHNKQNDGTFFLINISFEYWPLPEKPLHGEEQWYKRELRRQSLKQENIDRLSHTLVLQVLFWILWKEPGNIPSMSPAKCK